MSRRTRKRISLTIIMVLSLIVASFCCGMYVQKTESQGTSDTHAQKNRVALFFGDSYSHGVGASGQRERWTTQLSGQMGITEINAAIPGEGYQRRAATCEARICPYFLESLQQFNTVDADIVILSGGQNDLAKIRYESEKVAHAVEKTLNYLAKNYSEAQIYVVGPTIPQAFHDEAMALDTILSTYSEINGLEYISLSPIWTYLWENLIVDQQHVDNLGHDIISDFIFEYINEQNGHDSE